MSSQTSVFKKCLLSRVSKATTLHFSLGYESFLSLYWFQKRKDIMSLHLSGNILYSSLHDYNHTLKICELINNWQVLLTIKRYILDNTLFWTSGMKTKTVIRWICSFQFSLASSMSKNFMYHITIWAINALLLSYFLEKTTLLSF